MLNLIKKHQHPCLPEQLVYELPDHLSLEVASRPYSDPQNGFLLCLSSMVKQFKTVRHYHENTIPRYYSPFVEEISKMPHRLIQHGGKQCARSVIPTQAGIQSFSSLTTAIGSILI